MLFSYAVQDGQLLLKQPNRAKDIKFRVSHHFHALWLCCEEQSCRTCSVRPFGPCLLGVCLGPCNACESLAFQIVSFLGFMCCVWYQQEKLFHSTDINWCPHQKAPNSFIRIKESVCVLHTVPYVLFFSWKQYFTKYFFVVWQTNLTLVKLAVYLDTTIKTNHLYYLCDFQYLFLHFGTSSKELYINSKTTSMSSLSSCCLLFPGTARQFIETRNKILPFHCEWPS